MDLVGILALVLIGGLAMAIQSPGTYVFLLLLAIGGALLHLPFIVWERQNAMKTWDHLCSGYAIPVVLPVASHSLATNALVNFASTFQRPLWFPDAGVFLDQGTDAIRLVAHDHTSDVLLPVEMIAQIEFDAGDSPVGHRKKKTSLRKRLLGRYYMPTVFLGVTCGEAKELVVYPLAFHPDMEEDAHVLYQRLHERLKGVSTKIACPLSPEAFEALLPGSLDTQSLPRHVLRRFWPDYKDGRVMEWLSH